MKESNNDAFNLEIADLVDKFTVGTEVANAYGVAGARKKESSQDEMERVMKNQRKLDKVRIKK